MGHCEFAARCSPSSTASGIRPRTSRRRSWKVTSCRSWAAAAAPIGSSEPARTAIDDVRARRVATRRANLARMNPYVIPWMDEDLEVFRDTVVRFIESEMLPNDAKWREQHHVDRETWSK